MTKKIVAALLVLCLVVGLSACSKPGEDKPPEKIEPPFTDEDGITIYPVGNTATLRDWDIKFVNYTTKAELEDSRTIYEAADDYQFVVATMEVTNNGDEERAFLPLVSMNAIEAYLYPLEYLEEGVYEVENITGYAYNSIGQTVEAGKTETIYVVFHILTKEAEEDLNWRLEFYYEDMTGFGENDESIYFTI